MGIKIYKAPNCLRCTITKAFMDDKGMSYEAIDFKEEKEVFNTFYRTQRPRLYRNPEGVEFPLFHDEDKDVIKQGTGEILAFLLSNHALEACVTRSDLLHGWISGLYVSQCPAGHEENFLRLVRLLAKGGLQVYLQSDGRKADLLEKILAEDLVTRMVLNIPGPAALYPALVGGEAPTKEDMAKSIALVNAHKSNLIRLWLKPFGQGEDCRYITPAEAGDAAKMVADACGQPTLLFAIQLSEDKPATGEALEDSGLLPYRSKVRNHLPKADISKETSH